MSMRAKQLQSFQSRKNEISFRVKKATFHVKLSSLSIAGDTRVAVVVAATFRVRRKTDDQIGQRICH